MYTGHVGRIHETEIPQLLLLARCLQINGILAALRVPVDCNPQVSPEKTIPTHPDPSSPPTVLPMDEDEEGEDDVFVDDNAEDLSPSNRYHRKDILGIKFIFNLTKDETLETTVRILFSLFLKLMILNSFKPIAFILKLFSTHIKHISSPKNILKVSSFLGYPVFTISVFLFF